MLKCAPGVWRKRELYKIEKSLIVFEKKNMLKTWRLAPGYPTTAWDLPNIESTSVRSTPQTRGSDLLRQLFFALHTLLANQIILR